MCLLNFRISTIFLTHYQILDKVPKFQQDINKITTKYQKFLLRDLPKFYNFKFVFSHNFNKIQLFPNFFISHLIPNFLILTKASLKITEQKQDKTYIFDDSDNLANSDNLNNTNCLQFRHYIVHFSWVKNVKFCGWVLAHYNIESSWWSCYHLSSSSRLWSKALSLHESPPSHAWESTSASISASSILIEIYVQNILTARSLQPQGADFS